MVLNHAGKVWVGRRAEFDEVGKGEAKRWQMPQGGIDTGEEPLAAAKRELWEETGIRSIALLEEAPDWIRYDLPPESVGVALGGRFRGQTQRWFAFRFDGDDDEINILEPPNGSQVEFDAWDWVDMERLPELIVPFKRRLYEEVVGVFRHLAVS